MYKHFFKRLIDFTVALCVLLVIWPILLIITVWLHFANRGAGAFFFQERPGKNEKIFKVIKFKTLTEKRNIERDLLLNAPHLTKTGRSVRSTAIDKLSQFINILRPYWILNITNEIAEISLKSVCLRIEQQTNPNINKL